MQCLIHLWRCLWQTEPRVFLHASPEAAVLLFNHFSPSSFLIRSVRPTRRLNERKKEGGLKEERVELNKGPSIKYVRRFFSFLDPLPPLVRILSQNTLVNSRNLAYYVRFWVPSPPPPRCVRTLWMLPNVLKERLIIQRLSYVGGIFLSCLIGWC